MGTRTSCQTLEAAEFGTEVEGFVRPGNKLIEIVEEEE